MSLIMHFLAHGISQDFLCKYLWIVIFVFIKTLLLLRHRSLVITEYNLIINIEIIYPYINNQFVYRILIFT